LFSFSFRPDLSGSPGGNYGFGLVSIEENELTADFLLSKPVSRGSINHQAAGCPGCLTLTNLLYGSAVSLQLLFSRAAVHLMSALCFNTIKHRYFPIVLPECGLIISLLVKRVRSVTPFSLGLALALIS